MLLLDVGVVGWLDVGEGAGKLTETNWAEEIIFNRGALRYQSDII
jgi:hypothetical protein